MKTGKKSESAASKSAWAIILVGIALIAIAIWFGLNSHKKSSTEAAPSAPETPASQASAPVPPTAPVKPAAITVADNGSLAVIPISLTNVIIESENNVDAAMKALPQGTQVYGGIEFWLEGAVQLQSQATRDEQRKNFRDSVIVPLGETNDTDGRLTVTQRGQNIASIYILGGTRFASLQDGEKFADVVWHYADGTSLRTGLEYDVHLRDWARKPYESPARLPNPLTKVAWHGPHPTRKDRTLRLYRVALVNPHPEKIISAIEFASALNRPSLFVCALTLDPLMPGARPDNLTSDEMTDPELNGQLQIYVLDSDGHALSGAQVSVNSQSTPAGRITQKFTTDNNGMALVRYPDTALDSLDVSAEHDGFSGRKMLWDLKTGDTVPTSYTLKLAPEVQIGGTVFDPDNNPVPGATVSVYRFWTGNDDSPNKKGEQPSFSNQTQTTDTDGRWQAKGLPVGLLDRIGFNIKHPDFITAQENVVNNPNTEKQLRDGTYKTILQRGLDVHGRVVDSSDVPISGATVWAGRKYTQDRKSATSDDNGQFSFHTVPPGDVLFSVMAKGHSPDNKTVSVQTNMDEIVFRLSAGNVIRAHLQDESGQPVAGARVNLEGDYNDPSYYAYDFSATTDSNGDFSWDSAPAEAMTFYMYHAGFAEKRGVKLAPNQDNTVIMHPARTLSGVVLDATTQQPVTQFSVRTGTANGDGASVSGVINDKSFTAPDGKFTLSLNEENDNAVVVTADDYADTLQKFPDAQNGTVSVVVQMKPSPGLSGMVLAPDGTPAPGVGVAVASGGSGSYIQLVGGHLRSYSQGSKIAITDADGHFKVAVPTGDGIVVAAGDLGFASAPLDAVRSSGTLNLLAWGSIQGTLKIGGQPGVGKDLLFNPSAIPGLSTDFNGYKSTTDDQGQFSMEDVPPGDGSIVRLVPTAPNSWTWSDSTAVTVKSGEPTQVTIGDNGAVIVGNVRYDNPPTNASAIRFSGTLSAPMPPQPAFDSPADAQAYYQSAEWKAAMQLHKSYTMEMKPDGTFTTDDVPSGNYTLSVTAQLAGPNPWMNPPLAQGSIPVTVPDSFDPSSPINVGEVVLTPTPPPAQPAPSP